MEPPSVVPPDRADRHLVLRPPSQQPQQQQLVTVQQARPILTLNLPQPQQSQSQSHTQSLTGSAGSPAIAAAVAGVVVASSSSSSSGGAGVGGGGGNNNNAATVSSTSPALASTATAISATTQAATAFSGSSVGHPHQLHHGHHPVVQQQNSSSAASSLLGGIAGGGGGGGGGGGTSSSTSSGHSQQQTIEKLSRPMAFDKMESLVREMQDPEHGVPVRQQKMFLTSIPYAFMGYDLIEWLMDRLLIEESEALNIANQLCLHGYFFPVNDTKTLTVKDDSSLYRFQTPYYWPWQHKAPDNVEYAIYLAKRSLRNKQRHALEDYEAEALASLHKNLKGKWDFISMQAEEQVRLAKERKKGDKIVGDSQERAYWRVHRPPPGQFTPLEPCPIPSRDRQGAKPNKKKTVDDVQREVDYLKKSLNRTRMKMSQACESLVGYSETFAEYDFFLQPVLPSNPWVTEDITFWQLNNTFVDIPTEKRVKRWAISIEELVSDPTGLQEFTAFLEKEYSHENIRFWIAVNRLRRSAHSQVARKVNEIYDEFLRPGAPCEINIDGKTMESVLKGLKSPSRFTFDGASEHIYMLLLKKDCYPRFIRSDHYKRLLETGIQPSHKKRFFNFGGVSGAKKKMTAALSSQPNLGDAASGKGGAGSGMMTAPPPGSLSRRRGSDRSLTGSAHELAVIGVNKDMSSKVPHSHSQSNLSEIPYSSDVIYRGDMAKCHRLAMDAAYGNRSNSLHTHPETPKPKAARLETTVETASSAVCPWDMPDEPPSIQAPVPLTQVKLSICPWEQDTPSDTSANATKPNSGRLTSTSSDITDVSDRMQRNLGIRHQNTVDSGEAGIKRLIPNFTEQRRASVSFTPSRIGEYTLGQPSTPTKPSSTQPPTVSGQGTVDTTFPPLFTPLQAQNVAVAIATTTSDAAVITKDPPSSSDAEIEEELNKLSISERNSESSTSDLSALQPSTPAPTPPPITKVTPPPPPPPPPDDDLEVAAIVSAAESPSVSRDSLAAETQVEAVVQEVQIELIEANHYHDLKIAQPRRMETPTIQVQEPAADDPADNSSETPKSPRKIMFETDDAKDDSMSRMSPIKLGSATQSLVEQQTAEASVESGGTDEQNATPEPTLSQQPPPPPEIGPMEEEERLQEEENYGTQEELSPTTDEYQEGLQFGADSKDDYDYDIVDTDSNAGYIPPAPTPAPSMAPLAELDVDTVDDDLCENIRPAPAPAPPTPVEVPTPTTEEVKRRRKKRNSDAKKMSSLEEKDKATTSTGAGTTDSDRNTVCPWEDENISTSDGTFVKTYATLGYL